jgi:AraC-like DNA-binding protein
MLTQKKKELHPFEGGQLSHAVFEEIRKEYRAQYGYTVVYSDLDGNLVYGLPNCDKFPCQESCRLARQQSIDRVINYGSPLPTRCPSTYLFWSLPVCLNNRILGGLITVGVQGQISPSHPEKSLQVLIRAQEGLMEIAERYNIINNAFLQQRRLVNRASSDIFREVTSPRIPDLKELWRTQSKYFFEAIKVGDRKGIFRELTGVLAILRKADPQALPEAKGFALELFASTVEASLNGNHDRKTFFVFHYEIAEKIVLCQNLEAICYCIHDGLENFLQATHNPKATERNHIVRKVLNYIESHLDDPLTRDIVAKKVGISPSRLSHLLKEENEQTYTEIVKRFRMERARDALIASDKSISLVAIECGFCDQSHFTKVFQKYFGLSPAEYRREHSRD